MLTHQCQYFRNHAVLFAQVRYDAERFNRLSCQGVLQSPSLADQLQTVAEHRLSGIQLTKFREDLGQFDLEFRLVPVGCRLQFLHGVQGISEVTGALLVLSETPVGFGDGPVQGGADIRLITEGRAHFFGRLIEDYQQCDLITDGVLFRVSLAQQILGQKTIDGFGDGRGSFGFSLLLLRVQFRLLGALLLPCRSITLDDQLVVFSRQQNRAPGKPQSDHDKRRHGGVNERSVATRPLTHSIEQGRTFARIG